MGIPRFSRVFRGLRAAGAGRPRTTAAGRDRRGAAAVEFALVAPLLFLGVAMPMIEFGRAMMVMDVLSNAACVGCRKGTLPGSNNTAVAAAVSSNLGAAHITGATTAIQVNGASTDVGVANQGDAITVTVSVPYRSVSWLPKGLSHFLDATTLTRTEVMRKE